MKKKIIVVVALLAVLMVIAGCANAVNALLLKGKWTVSSYTYLNFGDDGVFTGNYNNYYTLNGTYELSGTTVTLKYTITITSTGEQFTDGADDNGQFTAEGTLTTSSNSNNKDTLRFSGQCGLASASSKYYRQTSI